MSGMEDAQEEMFGHAYMLLDVSIGQYKQAN